MTGESRARLHAQLLTGRPARTPEEVVGRLLAVQAQDLRGARLAIRARSTGLTASEVDRALTERRTLGIAWLNRGTLHLVRREDYWPLHQLTAPRLVTGNRRRLRQEGVSPEQAERGVEVVVAALEEAGALDREGLRARLDDAGVPTAGQALVHLLLLASLRARVIRGPWRDGRHGFVLAEQWWGPAPESMPEAALHAWLAARYFAGHAPATDRDLATWAGLPLGAARRALAEAARDEPTDPGSLPAPVLLGPFDPLLHGWVDRAPVLGAHREVVTRNGMFRAVALVEGRAAGTWTLPGGRVRLDPFDASSGLGDRLAADAADVERFLAG